MDGVNVVAVSGLFAQFSGTMAAVSFTALVLILTLRWEAGDRAGDLSGVRFGNARDGAASLFLVSFTAFTFAQQAYNLLGSEQGNVSRGYSELICGDVLFAVAFIHTFFGLQVVMSSSGLMHSASIARMISGLLITPIAFGLIYSDVARTLPKSVTVVGVLSGLGIYCTTVGLVVIRKWPLAVPTVSFVNVVVLVFLASAIGIAVFVQTQKPAFLLPEVVAIPLMIGFNAIMGMFTLIAFRDRFGAARTSEV